MLMLVLVMLVRVLEKKKIPLGPLGTGTPGVSFFVGDGGGAGACDGGNGAKQKVEENKNVPPIVKKEVETITKTITIKKAGTGGFDVYQFSFFKTGNNAWSIIGSQVYYD